MRLLPKNISHVIKVQTCRLSIRWTSPKSVSAPSDFNKLILVALIDELIKLYYFFCKLYDFWCKKWCGENRGMSKEIKLPHTYFFPLNY